jgi:hypothetical protein
MKNTLKKIIYFYLFSCSILTYAQVENRKIEKTFTEAIDSMTFSINKSLIKTNILYDRVVSFAHLDIFHQEKEKIVSNGTHFFQAWSELYRASYNPRPLQGNFIKKSI